MTASLLVAGFFALVMFPSVDGARRLTLKGGHRQADEFTVSGHDSGGSMASQHLFAYSDVVKGLGHLQAAPYACKISSNQFACSTQPSFISVPNMVAYAEQQAQAGNIAPLQNMKQRPIWVFAGGHDTAVLPSVCMRAVDLYSNFSVNVTYFEHPGAGHAYITDGTSPVHYPYTFNRCDAMGVPYLNDCRYDMAGDMLAHVLGRRLYPPTPQVNAHFLLINQTQFFPGMNAWDIGMNTRAFAYVPAPCWQAPDVCAIHVMYHGCNASVSSVVADRIYKLWGGNEWAESNQLIMLYPQAWDFNCWDWTGTQATWLDPQHDTRTGTQITVVNRMVSALRGLVLAAR